MSRTRNVFFATDFSPASRPAFRRAVDIAAASGATLWIGHVIPEAPGHIDGGALPRMYREMDAYVRKDADRRLRTLVASARGGGARARSLVLRGVPHEAIRRAARGHRADMIVLGTHGRTGLSRLVVGSVASRVVATAPCPVLTVKP
jgi:nucleotide-binding universal stress UspA family protein